MPAPRRPLQRSRHHRLLGGVCGGLAERLGWSPAAVRLLFVLLSMLPVLPGLPVYLLLWWVMPLEGAGTEGPTPAG